MIVVGIDPGLTMSALAAVRLSPAALLGVASMTTTDFQPDTLRAVPAALRVQRWHPDVIAVESARGFVVKGRDADPVLRDAAMGGRIAGALLAGYPDAAVVEMPALSNRQGYNWRELLGVGGMTDAGIRAHLGTLLGGPLPKSVSGHHVDAAGIALATALRLHGRGCRNTTPREVLEATFYGLSQLEMHVLAAQKDARAARKKARAGAAKLTTLGHAVDPAVLRPRRTVK